MSKLSEFTLSSARPLPVILLADVSGSMSVNGKIDVLNASVYEMIRDFAKEDSARAEIHASVITFGGKGANLHQPLTPAENIAWTAMSANGKTPMGAAFSLARELIENKETISGRAYRPTIILVSDGKPTDDWEVPLAELIGSERASKAFRFAMGIGDDAEVDTLQKFADQTAHVFTAGEAGGDIRKFFKWVTMSVSTRTRSVNPDQPEEFDIFDVEDEFDDDF
jgi:uncharacterized protein YegL